MYEFRPNLIIGFHGCDASVRESLFNNPDEIIISKEPYDWLGHGMYFWENNYDRALQWAEDKKRRNKIKTPSVIGAVLYLGYCCDFLDTKHIRLLSQYHAIMLDRYKYLEKELPKNKDLPSDKHKDKILRELDCAVIEFMHDGILSQIEDDISGNGLTEYKAFNSTRGMFTEGGPAFEGAGLHAKSHTQICIRNPNCIQGFFLPRRDVDFTGRLEMSKPVKQ